MAETKSWDSVSVGIARAKPGDLICDETGPIGEVSANTSGIFLVEFEMFDWHWAHGRIDTTRATLPIPAALREMYRRHSGGRSLRGAVLDVVRPV